MDPTVYQCSHNKVEYDGEIFQFSVVTSLNVVRPCSQQSVTKHGAFDRTQLVGRTRNTHVTY